MEIRKVVAFFLITSSRGESVNLWFPNSLAASFPFFSYSSADHYGNDSFADIIIYHVPPLGGVIRLAED